MTIILDVGSWKELKMGRAAMLSSKRLANFVHLQLASWSGGLPAAAKEVEFEVCMYFPM